MNNQKPTYKVVDPVGSLKNWYQKANEYWKVYIKKYRNRMPLTMEFCLVLELLVKSILKGHKNF